MVLRIPLAGLLAGLTFFIPAAAEARSCVTLAQLHLQRDHPSASTAMEVARPPVDESIDSALYPIRLHGLTDQDLIRRDEVMAILEEAWTLQVVEQGYEPPLPDGTQGGSDAFDVYLVPLANRTAFTAAEEDADPNDGRHAAPSFMVVDDTIDEAFLASFIHHEMAHVLQFRVDMSESLFLFEASASLQEILARPNDLAFATGIGDFQDWPNAPIFTNGIDWAAQVGEDSLYEYGGALFLLYLEEVVGQGDGKLVRDLWVSSIQADDVLDNEPDWLDVLTGQMGENLDDRILDFSTWRALVGPLAVEGRGPPGAVAWPAETALDLRRISIASIDGEDLPLSSFDAPRQTGCIVLQHFNETDGDQPLTVDAEALDRSSEQSARLGVGYTLLDANGQVADIGQGIAASGLVEVPFIIGPGETLYASVCALDDSVDADDLPDPRPVRIALWPGAVERPDAGSSPTDGGGKADGGVHPPPPLCSCQSVPGPFDAVKPYATFAMVFIGLGMAIARYRRARRNKASFKGSWKKDAR
jgi:hypothetical protein